MYIERECPRCSGRGLTAQQTSTLFGLLRRRVTAPCALCCGQGRVRARATCRYCGGRGLLGNESEICRLCNGTGNLDEFSKLTLNELVPGVTFRRRCEKCDSGLFEIAQDIEAVRQATSWAIEEELRDYETSERIRIRCLQCANSYLVPVDRTVHEQNSQAAGTADQYVLLEGSSRCARMKCEYYCPEGYCLLSERRP